MVKVRSVRFGVVFAAVVSLVISPVFFDVASAQEEGAKKVKLKDRKSVQALKKATKGASRRAKAVGARLKRKPVQEASADLEDGGSLGVKIKKARLGKGATVKFERQDQDGNVIGTSKVRGTGKQLRAFTEKKSGEDLSKKDEARASRFEAKLKKAAQKVAADPAQKVGAGPAQ